MTKNFGCNTDDNVTDPLIITGNNVPSAPRNFKVSPNFYCPLLTWEAPIDSGLSKITKYNIYRGTFGNVNIIGSVSSNKTQIPDTTGSENTTYIYFVTAVNSYGESPRATQDTNRYNSITGNWEFVFIQDGNYTNPPPTDFYINSLGNFNKSVRLWVGIWGGGEQYALRTITGRINEYGKIVNGIITGGITNGQIKCNQNDNFNTNNYKAKGSFSHYVTYGSNNYYLENGIWEARK